MSELPRLEIGEGALLGVDTNLFIYHFEDNPEFGPAASRLLEAAESGRWRLVASVMSLMEVLVLPRRQGREALCQRYRDFFRAFPNLTVLPVGPDVAELASDLRAHHRIRTPDALHLATATFAGASAFVSEDSRLPHLTHLPIVRLAELTRGLHV